MMIKTLCYYYLLSSPPSANITNTEFCNYITYQPKNNKVFGLHSKTAVVTNAKLRMGVVTVRLLSCLFLVFVLFFLLPSIVRQLGKSL